MDDEKMGASITKIIVKIEFDINGKIKKTNKKGSVGYQTNRKYQISDTLKKVMEV